MERPVLNGIVIEGTDFVGKTTLANNLLGCLARFGLNAFHRKCFLSKEPIIQFLSAPSEGRSLEESDWMLTAAYLLDDINPRELDNFAIQERNWISQVARNRFFHGEKFVEYSRRIEQRHYQFSTQIYLHSCIDAKRARAASRPPKGTRNALLSSDPVLHQEFDEFSMSILPKNEQWLIVDTSSLSPVDVCNIVLKAAGELGSLTEANSSN
ncbi:MULTISPECIES: hypothetical protein [unclassified Bradyrhizobium]|uniref:hypothetical protein n=1 Tax=unclassified Bradyrhizobium TaxID=2631580 RepID=UPI0028EA6BDE|nr:MULTISPECIES: hypothetical protein [unclassified Bradyrhizobium]